MWAKRWAWTLFALFCTIGLAPAQDIPFDNGWEQARQRAIAMKEAHVARGAEVLDYGYVDRGYGDGSLTLHNRGSEAVLVVACEDRCTRLEIVLAARGFAPVRMRSGRGDRRSLEFHIPANFVAAPSDWRLRINARSGGDGSCDYAWWLVALSPAPPLDQRGGPRLLTDAEWEAGVDLPDGVSLRWAQRPNFEQIRSLYPPGALRRGQEGTVVLACVVSEGGYLLCRPESETPEGQGFAEAALRFSSIMRSEASDTAGQPTLGRRIHLPVRFSVA